MAQGTESPHPPVESVFTSPTDALLEAAERLLRASGVEPDLALEALPEAPGSNVCNQRLVLRVPSHQAGQSRRLLIDAGFSEGLVGPG